MNVASHSLCKELYELSGWYFGGHTWHHSDFNDLWTLAPAPDKVGKTYKVVCPAYDLGYLLRKLPESVDSIYGLLLYPTSGGQWFAGYYEPDGLEQYEVHADTPEDAACKLAIELFKQGVLKKEKS